MAAVLKLFEECLKKIGGDSVEIRINYDKVPQFDVDSDRKLMFWQIVSKFLEKMQVLVQESVKPNHSEEDQKDSKRKTLLNDNDDRIPPQRGSFDVDPSLVQITASKNEMDRRMAAFLRKKRLDVDIQNQREFCNLLNKENEFSCARVDAVFLPRVGQRSHITVTDANRENDIMKSDNITVDSMLHSLPAKRPKTEITEHVSQGIEERLANMESHLKMNVTSVQNDVYSRLKQLEEKILYLEGLSPEYFKYKNNCGRTTSRRFSSDREPQRRSSETDYGEDLDERIVQLRRKLLSERNTAKRKRS